MKRYSQVLFLCTTNTLLSPLAEAVYRRNSPHWMPKGISRGLVVLFEEPIHPKCDVLLTQNGYDISGHNMSRQLREEDIMEDSLILTMTLSEKVKFTENYHREENVYTIGEFVGEDTDVKNPSGGKDEKYRECFAELSLRVNKVIQKIEEQYWEE